jgi:hypothetical protein
MRLKIAALLWLLAAISSPALAARNYDVRDFGAKADFQTNDGPAIQAAIDACHKAGGGTVVVSAGRYLSGTIELRTNVTLHLEPGATIFGSRNREHYQGSKAHGANRGHLLVADNVENIGVTGQGTLNGQAEEDFGKRWGASEDASRFRNGIILFTGARNVTLRDFTIRFSDFWTLHLKDCDTVTIDAVKILNNVRHLNSDGIDLTSCRNVHITNCHLVAGDDTIDPKTQDGKPTENIVVTNCTLETTTTGIKLGTASDGDFRNLHFSNITIKAPTGIGFYMKDGGTAENVTFSNIVIENPPATYRVATPLFIDIEKRHANSRLSHIRDISFRDIFIRGGSGILIQGMPESRIENLSIENLNFRVTAPDSYQKRSKPVGGARTTKDERDTRYIQMSSYFAVAYVDGLYLDKIRIVQSEEARAKYERSAMVIHESRQVTVRGVESTPPRGQLGLPLIGLHNVDGALISDSVALAGTGTFVEVTGARSGNVVVTGGRLGMAVTPKKETR